MRMTQRRSIDWGRKQQVTKYGPSLDDDDRGHEPEDEGPEESFRRVEAAVDLAAQIPDLLDAMSMLTANERQVIVRQTYDDASRAELADELGVTPPRISQLRTSALTKLKQYLERR